MNNLADFKNASITVSQVTQGSKQGKGIWELKGWNKNFDTLKDNSFCTIKVGPDRRHGVRIFFGDYFQSPTNVADPQRPGYFKQVTYVPLWVQLKMVGRNSPLIDLPVTVSLDVHQLSENLVSEKNIANGTVTFKLGAKPQAAVIETFLEYSYLSSNSNYDELAEDYNECCCHNRYQDDVTVSQPDNLRFGIIATVSPINDALALESSEKLTSISTLKEQFKKLYQSDANFSDLKLETKDNVILSSHKFVLAARSSMLNELIKMETEKEDFSGTVKLDVDAKPMLAILHWMYTGEVDDKAGLVMEQLIEIAVKFDLSELLQILDKKMISICTENNMFPLYQTAKKRGMVTAVDDVGAFITRKLARI